MTEDTRPASPRSARELAEQVLDFREANAPDKKRFHERALLVDNGRRGSEQKAVIFTVDDLSALLMDLLDAERQRDQWKEFAMKHPEITPPVVTQELASLREALATTEEARGRWHQKYIVEAQAHEDEVKILGEELTTLRRRHAELCAELRRA